MDSSSTPPTPPPQPHRHRQRQPSSPPLYTPPFSPASSDHTSLGFFSPRGGEDEEDDDDEEQQKQHHHVPSKSPPLSPVVMLANKSVREQSSVLTKVEEDSVPAEAAAGGVVEEGNYGDFVVHGGSGGDRGVKRDLPVVRKQRRESSSSVRSSELGLRLIGMVTCMISFSVMAADKNQGWALDSSSRYKEFRYCMWINVMVFVYSGAQACDLGYNFSKGKYSGQQNVRYFLDFCLDQMFSYLLISASSSAATRVDDWQSNWGKDKFTQMASASVALSFISFLALATASVISGYNLCFFKFT